MADRQRILSSPPESGDDNRSPRITEGSRKVDTASRNIVASGEQIRAYENDLESPSDSDNDNNEDVASFSLSNAGNESSLRKKNAPVSQRGSKFTWNDNQQYRSYARAPFKIGIEQPELLSITLKDVNGKESTWFREGHGTPQWNNLQWIKQSNNWWAQLISRKLNLPNPESSTARETRRAWTEREMQHIKSICKNELERLNASKLTQADMIRLANQHNAKFEDFEFSAGEKLLLVEEDGKQYKRARKTAVTTPYVFAARTTVGIISMMRRFPDTKAFLEESAATPAPPAPPENEETERLAEEDYSKVATGDSELPDTDNEDS